MYDGVNRPSRVQLALHQLNFPDLRRLWLKHTFFHHRNQVTDIPFAAHAAQRDVGVKRPLFPPETEGENLPVEALFERPQGPGILFAPEPHDAWTPAGRKRAQASEGHEASGSRA